MSEIEDKNRLSEITTTYEIIRSAAVLDMLGGVAITSTVDLDLDSAEGVNALLDAVRDNPESEALDEFDDKTRLLFKPVNGFYLHTVDANFMELDNTTHLHARRGKTTSHVSLTARITGGELVLERLRHVGSDHQQMKVTEADWETLRAALDELQLVNDTLTAGAQE